MKNKILTFKISVSLILIFTFMIIPAQSDIPDHKQVFCFDCHTDGKYYYEEVDNDDCGGCHKYVDASNKLNLNRLEENHNPNTCKVCHRVENEKVFHALHENVPGSCTKCHGSYGNAIPDRSINECVGCHGSQVHIIHQDNLTGICSNCHGSRPGSNPKSISSLSKNELTAGIYAKVVNYKQFTLYEIFQRILSSFSI